MKNYIGTKLLALVFGLLLLVQCKEPASLSAIVISDSAPDINGVFKVILENSGLFDVDINKKESPAFADYDVVILNLQKAEWSDEVKSNFETYLKGGGGVVLVGPSITAFESWAGSKDLFGIDVQKNLPKSNKAYDYQVVNTKVEHPVTNGLPSRWIHGSDYMIYNTDELSDNSEILATARADSVHGGDNSFFPILFSCLVGEGRVFCLHTGIWFIN